MTSVSNARKQATWHAIVLISDVLTVTIMDMLLQIAVKKYHLQVHQHTTGTTPLVGVTDQHLGIIATPGIPTVIIGTDRDSVTLNFADITLDTGVIPKEVVPDHYTGPHIIALHTTGAQAHIATATTHHIADPHHAEISPKMTVYPEQINPASTTTNPPTNHLPVHSQHPGRLRIEDTNRLTLMIYPWSITALMNKTVIQRMI